jgi:hypothetical protein
MSRNQTPWSRGCNRSTWCASCGTHTPTARLERLPRLKMIASTGSGNASIDAQAAQEHPTHVTATGYRSTPAIELTWALMLAAARNLVGEASSLRVGGWQTSVTGTVRQGPGRAGSGRIDSEMARIGSAFGMDVIAWRAVLHLPGRGALRGHLVLGAHDHRPRAEGRRRHRGHGGHRPQPAQATRRMGAEASPVGVGRVLTRIERDAGRHARVRKVGYAVAGSRSTAGRNWRIGRAARRLRHLSNSSTTVTPTGTNSGDSPIRKMKIGSIMIFSHSPRSGSLVCVVSGELVVEFLARNLRAEPQVSDVVIRPTFEDVLSSGDKPLRSGMVTHTWTHR